MSIDTRSELLFGRYQALRVYATIARLPKPEFSTGDVAALSGVPVADCSKELARLVRLEVVRRRSRRGNYERDDETSFWTHMDSLADLWGFSR